MIRHLTFSLLGIAVAGIVGCEVGPDYHAPQINVTDDWGELGKEATTQPTTNPASKIVSRPPPMIEWWTTFHDPKLDELIRRAVAENLDLQKATIRVREARAARAIAASALFPKLDVDGSYEHARSSQNGLVSAGGSSNSTNVGGGVGSNGGAAESGTKLTEFDLYQAGFDASWELDIWGGNRRAVEAANAAVDALIETRRSTMLTLLGEVAVNYVQLRETQQRLLIARRNLDVQKHSLELTNQQLQRGLTSELDSDRAQAQVYTTQATIPNLESTEAQTVHQLSILLNLRPTELADELRETELIPAVPDEVPVGLPSDLLRRRPDIRRAERVLAANTAGVGVATAQLFPTFSLTGSIGTQARKPSDLVDYASRYYSIGPSINWPLFDAGRIRAQIKIAKDEQLNAYLSYRQTVLSALKDVEDALVAYGKAQERAVALRQAVAANERAVRISNDLYSRGLTDYINVSDAQRDLLDSQDSLVSAEGAVRTELVTLYKALGGGWEIDAISQATQQVPASQDDAETKRSPI